MSALAHKQSDCHDYQPQRTHNTHDEQPRHRDESRDSGGKRRYSSDSKSPYQARRRDSSERHTNNEQLGEVDDYDAILDRRSTTSMSRSHTCYKKRRMDDCSCSRRGLSGSRSPPRHRQWGEDNDELPEKSGKSSRRRRSRSPRRSRHSSRSPAKPYSRAKGALPSKDDAFRGQYLSTQVALPMEKQKPNFKASGKLAAETNTVHGTGIVLKYHEPPEARKPPASQAWRLYVFKGSETLDTVEIHKRSCWLFGRERFVVDYLIEHPSCSKQQAVLQFRYFEKKNEFGDRIGGVKPYIIDLESANGTRVNGEEIPERRFFELKSGDILTFGESTREYVLMLPPCN